MQNTATGATLVILAAGVGRRFGGLKQLAPVGPAGEAVMDFTVFDALQAGFDRVVLVIRRDTEELMRAHVARGLARQVPVEIVFQEIGSVPEGSSGPVDRTRPWGTGQAVLAAKPWLDRPFAVANADDYYGAPAMTALGRFLQESQSKETTWAMAGFSVRDTVPETGSVSRGIVRRHQEHLVSIEEVTGLRRHPQGACWDSDRGLRVIDNETTVSMNLWGFTTDLVAHLESGFERFLAANPGPEEEFYLPVAIGDAVDRGLARVRILTVRSPWCGMTSAQDLDRVRNTLAQLVAADSYPDPLWI